MWVTKQLLVHIDFDSIGNTADQQLFGFHLLQNRVYDKQKKEAQV